MASKQNGTYTGSNPMGGQDAVAITPHDTTDIAVRPDAIYVGVSGNIACEVKSGTVIFLNVPVGIFPISPTRVNTTSTTATDMFALYYR